MNLSSFINMDNSFFLFNLIFDFRGEERERNTDAERNINCCLLYVPRPGTESATQACTLAGIEPMTFHFAGRHPSEPRWLGKYG